MEQHSQTDDSVDSRHILEAQLRECYGRVVYSNKTQEKCADILLSKWSTIKFWQMMLSVLSTGAFVSGVFGSGKIGSLVGLLFSTTLLALNAYTKNYDLGQLAQKHKQAASDLWLIREKYLSLITDLLMGEKPLERLQGERDKLLEALHAVYSGAPPTTSKAYRNAQAALQKQEELTFAASEIDQLLPEAMRSTRKASPKPIVEPNGEAV